MGQEVASGGFFRIRYIINEIVDISLLDRGEEWARSEISLYYFNRYR